MTKILVTGGLGFIGSHTAVELINSGYEPVILDNLGNSRESVLDGIGKITGQKPRFYNGDFQDIKLLDQVISDNELDGVIHFAALKAVGESVKKPLDYYRNNVSGLVEFLAFLTDHKISNFVFSSSCTVYGEPDKVPIDESAPTKPATSPYGASKQMDEIIIRDTTAALPLRSTALRYFNPIGAHPSGHIGELPLGTPENLVPFLTQAVAGLRPKLTVYGNDYPTPDGTCIRDYIHVLDLAKAHIAALEHLSKQQDSYYDTFNIGTGKGASVLEVISAFEKANGISVPYVIGEKRAGDIISIYADPAKANKTLGWQASLSLSDALKDAWNWQQTLGK